MKTNLTLTPALGRTLYSRVLLGLTLLLVLLTHAARAQFPAVPSQTRFVCNAPGNQFGVQAFADGAGGAYQVWIDKRGGNTSGAGTALYAQRVNAAGAPLLADGGVRLFQTVGKDIFGVKAVAWQGGLLVAWVQGAFSVGGDTIRCQFYNAAGVPQWAQPTVVASRALPTVVYVLQYGLNIFPTSTGATITYDLTLSGGGDRLSFNQVNAAGALRFSNNQFRFEVPIGSSLLTLSDGGDGFYAVSGAGGFGSPIYAQHYDLNGAGWPALLDLTTTTGASGRGGQDWRAARDPAGNLYVVWGSESNDILAVKVTPAGALGWAAPGYVNLCSNPSRQDAPEALWHDNALWVIWRDDRLPTGSRANYMQRLDAAGTLAWPATGVLINSLPGGVYAYPKLAASDNGTVMAFYSASYDEGFRAQKVRPDASLVFPANGTVLHNVSADLPYLLDYVPVSQPNGSVQVYWASNGVAPTGQDICAGRMQASGTLLSAASRAAVALGFEVYPNPAAGELRLRYPTAGPAPTGLRLYDARGRLVRAFAAPGLDGALSLRGLAAGVYVLRAQLGGQPVSSRVAVTE